MNKCPNRTKKVFKFFTVNDKHAFVITNVFYTLEDQNLVDVVETCQACGEKKTLEMDKSTLIEVANKFPKAFNKLIREYILSWETI
jgi:hypothetical protein